MPFFTSLFNFLPTGRKSKSVDQRLQQIQLERKNLEQQALRNQDARLQQDEARADENDPVSRLIHGEVQAGFSSSNVAAYWYERQNLTLYIQYKDGLTYAYDGTSEAEVISLWQSASKGTWVWDNLRVRGTKLGARKEYVLAVSSNRGRQWEASHDTAREHSEEVAWQSGAKDTYAKLGRFQLKTPLTNKGRRKH